MCCYYARYFIPQTNEPFIVHTHIHIVRFGRLHHIKRNRLFRAWKTFYIILPQLLAISFFAPLSLSLSFSFDHCNNYLLLWVCVSFISYNIIHTHMWMIKVYASNNAYCVIRVHTKSRFSFYLSTYISLAFTVYYLYYFHANFYNRTYLLTTFSNIKPCCNDSGNPDLVIWNKCFETENSNFGDQFLLDGIIDKPLLGNNNNSH